MRMRLARVCPVRTCNNVLRRGAARPADHHAHTHTQGQATIDHSMGVQLNVAICFATALRPLCNRCRRLSRGHNGLIESGALLVTSARPRPQMWRGTSSCYFTMQLTKKARAGKSPARQALEESRSSRRVRARDLFGARTSHEQEGWNLVHWRRGRHRAYHRRSPGRSTPAPLLVRTRSRRSPR